MEMFSDVRVSNFYWLRDDWRSNPDVLSHLHAENSYVDFIMSGALSIPLSLSLPLSIWIGKVFILYSNSSKQTVRFGRSCEFNLVETRREKVGRNSKKFYCLV